MAYRSRRRRRTALTMPEITLTPLIDTALTLLIIFMVATPMIVENSLKIDLPQGEVKECAATATKQDCIVSIDRVDNTDRIYFNGTPISLADLKKKITDQAQHKTVWVKAGKATMSDTLVSVIDNIKYLGVKDVVVATRKTA